MSDILDRLRAHREKSAKGIPFTVEAWDLECNIRPISAAKHASLVKQYGDKAARLAAFFIINTLFDDKGQPVFKDDAETLSEMLQQPSTTLQGIAEDVMIELGISKTDDDDDPVDAAKNS